MFPQQKENGSSAENVISPRAEEEQIRLRETDGRIRRPASGVRLVAADCARRSPSRLARIPVMPRRLVRVATGWYKTPASSRPARAVVTCRERRMLHFLFFTRLRQDKRKPLVSLMLVSLACVSFVLPRLEVLCAVALPCVRTIASP